MLDPRTPVLIGAGQISQRVDRGEPELEPVDLLAEAARRAAADTGTEPGRVFSGLDSVRVVRLLSWRYRDPGRLVGERVGADPAQTLYTTDGGHTPQALVSRTALDIADGKVDLALIGGAEAWRTRMAYRARAAPRPSGSPSGDRGARVERGDSARDRSRPHWTIEPEDAPAAEPFGEDLDMSYPAEQARGIFMPVQMYPIFETALRAASGRSVAEHQVHISELWSRLSAVAAHNPNAWIQERFTPEQIRTPAPDNRLVGFPYPKRMNSNNAVEQAAALLLCSAERATALGVPRDRWVFPQSGANARDTPYVTHRRDLGSSPAIATAGGVALELAGIGADDLAHVDLYSCFPSAVQIGAAELGLSLDRQLTVTGGLSFAGGPWNNYVTHAIATMVGVLRDDPGAWGLCTANGGFVTKHALGIYRTEPPANGFRWDKPQAAVDAIPGRDAADDHIGSVTVEGLVVMHDREGEPENALVAVLTDDGRRTWGTTNDSATMKTMTEEEYVGRPADLSPEGTLAF